MLRWFVSPTIEEVLQKQYDEAQFSLAEQKAFQESANANVRALTARIKRLEADLENVQCFGTLTHQAPMGKPKRPPKVNLVAAADDQIDVNEFKNRGL